MKKIKRPPIGVLKVFFEEDCWTEEREEQALKNIAGYMQRNELELIAATDNTLLKKVGDFTAAYGLVLINPMKKRE